MAKFRLIVLTDPVPGREAEYNDWYNSRHLQDVVAVPGFTSAQRFRLKDLRSGQLRHRYLAIYEIDADNPEPVMEELMKRAGTSAMVLSDALDGDTADVAVFEECSQRVCCSGTGRA